MAIKVIESDREIPESGRCRVRVTHAYTVGMLDEGDDDAFTQLWVTGASVQGKSAVNGSFTGPTTAGALVNVFDRYNFSAIVGDGCTVVSCGAIVLADAYGAFQAKLTTGKGTCNGLAVLSVNGKHATVSIELDAKPEPGGASLGVDGSAKGAITALGQGASVELKFHKEWHEAADQIRSVAIDPVIQESMTGSCSFEANSVTTLTVGATNGAKFNDVAVTRVDIKNILRFNPADVSISCNCRPQTAPRPGHSGGQHEGPDGGSDVPPNQGQGDLPPRPQGLALRAAAAEVRASLGSLVAPARPVEDPVDAVLHQQALRAAELVFTSEQASEFQALRAEISNPVHAAGAFAHDRVNARLEAHLDLLEYLARLSDDGWNHPQGVVDDVIASSRSASRLLPQRDEAI